MRRNCARTLVSPLALIAASLVSASASAQVSYFGGRVISNVEVVEVAWGSGVDAGYLNQLEGYYKAVLVSPYMDWLSEYDTIGKTSVTDGQAGSNQHIGRGTFGGTFTIMPANGSSQLQDMDISNELVAQLNAGKVPPPKKDGAGNVNTLYMIDFPPGISITLLGIQSCSQFGAYHFTVKYKGDSIYYGVHPSCGYDFGHATLVHSHELIEAVTDAEVGLAVNNPSPGRPQAWAVNSQQADETGDLCNLVPGQAAGYTVQKIWSNFANGCVDNIPLCNGMGAPPACRSCISFDSGFACNGAAPACATAGPMNGQCVTCTSAYPAACTGATPVCDDSTYTCVGCLANTDCKSPNAFICDTASKTCRGCMTQADCKTGVCDVDADAQKGECVACNKDTDCKGDEQCSAHTCMPKPPPTTTAASGVGPGGFATGAGGAGSFTGAGGDTNANGDDGGLEGKCACRAAGASGPDGARALTGLAIAMAAAAMRRRRRG